MVSPVIGPSRSYEQHERAGTVSIEAFQGMAPARPDRVMLYLVVATLSIIATEECPHVSFGRT